MSNPPPILIAGCGPGHRDYVTPAVQNAVASAEVLVGARHLLELFSHVKARRLPVGADIQAVLDNMANYRQRRMVVLVSGDSGLFSLTRSVQQRFGREHCQLLPGISALQVACARLGIDWSEMRILSAHGRIPQLDVESLRAWRKIAIHAGTMAATVWVADLLEQLGSEYRALVCENLTLTDEKIRALDAVTLRHSDLATRTIIVLLHLQEQQ